MSDIPRPSKEDVGLAQQLRKELEEILTHNARAKEHLKKMVLLQEVVNQNNPNPNAELLTEEKLKVIKIKKYLTREVSRAQKSFKATERLMDSYYLAIQRLDVCESCEGRGEDRNGQNCFDCHGSGRLRDCQQLAMG